MEPQADTEAAERCAPKRVVLGPVTSLEGVGPARARALAAIGVRDLRDLLFLMPRRVSTSSAIVPIADACRARGAEVTVAGRVRRIALTRFGRRTTVRVTVADASGSIVALFFNQPWMRKHLAVEQDVELRGRVVDSKGPALASPKIGTSAKPLSAPGIIVPHYPTADGIGEERMRRWCRETARACADRIVDPLPEDARVAHGLVPLARAIAGVHEPRSADEFDAARRRLALEPLLRLQADVLDRRAARARGRALAARIDDALHAELVARFPYAFTAGQSSVAAEIRRDLERDLPMRRLLQGDVGSGKTALGVYACLLVADAGGQAAFLAPTELLAEQHFDGLRPLLARAGLRGVLLTGSTPPPERRQVHALLESGMADVAFGTHALFGESARYKRLALCVIDEQQRFGVAQRADFLRKGTDAHALLMTATPIPRTLALTLYGDLDVSLLKERPPGRGAVRTRWVRGRDRARVPAFLRERLELGERIYWVVPRIGAEGEDLDEALDEGRSSAELALERLNRTPIRAHGIELVHGRMPSDERARRLERFRSGASNVLVATTVIEVGVDVPEATVMVIEHAERFGLAQLHQLRGRIGRGAAHSTCLLLYKGPLGQTAKARLNIMRETEDGFRIAEEDLKLRGEGDVLGTRQSGLPGFRIARIEVHGKLIGAARDDAALVLAQDPTLASPRGQALRHLLYLFERDEAIRLIRAG
jgi:ATP-dependent DNA helicase RecG